MENCKNCVHKNVCKKVEEVNKLCGNLSVSYDLQSLTNLGISVDISCADFKQDGTVYTRIIKEED